MAYLWLGEISCAVLLGVAAVYECLAVMLLFLRNNNLG